MNIVSNSGPTAWPSTPSFKRPEAEQAVDEAAPDSSSQSNADSRPQPSTDVQATSVARSDSTPETQAFLMRVQELATASDASGNNDTQTLLDGLSADAMRVTVTGTTAIVSFSDGSNPLTLNLALGSVTLSFADGTTAQVMAQTPARKIQAVYEAAEEASRNFIKAA